MHVTLPRARRPGAAALESDPVVEDVHVVTQGSLEPVTRRLFPFPPSLGVPDGGEGGRGRARLRPWR